MLNHSTQLVQNPWKYCNILRDDGLSYSDSVEQTRIVAEAERRLSVVEGLSALVESNLKRAARLRQSILQRAFSGELLETPHATR
jgi:hypothetical protein